MPTFDFLGYSAAERDQLISNIKPVLAKLEFSKDIVFICRQDQGSKVLDLNDESKPFVRIYTRQETRAKILMDVLKNFFDIEILYLAYFQEQVPN